MDKSISYIPEDITTPNNQEDLNSYFKNLSKSSPTDKRLVDSEQNVTFEKKVRSFLTDGIIMKVE